MILVLALLLLLLGLLGAIRLLETEDPDLQDQKETHDSSETWEEVSVPWEDADSKRPEEYTWEEFENLTAAQQMAFQNFLGSEGFEVWANGVQSQVERNPWDESGSKQPEEYTWTEFEALTEAQQQAFQNHLGAANFEKWMSYAQNLENGNPWDEPGAKQPEAYSLEDFQKLTAAQQMAFQSYLGADKFEEWLSGVQNQNERNPWDAVGAKMPEEYTWEEFEKLTAGQQMAFQNYLGAEGFENWLSNAQSQNPSNPWEMAGAKQPEDYTWEDFEALTASQQMAFQNYLGPDEFEAWLKREEKP